MSRNTGSGQLRFTVSGPDTDKSYTSAEVAMSAAITIAEHCKKTATFYVRDVDGSAVGRVEHDDNGTRVYRDRAAKTKAVA